MEIPGCGAVKWLGHYSSEQTILVVGDGDLSFSLALATAFDTGDKLVATSLDTYDTLTIKYGNAKSNVTELKRLGATVLHCVDAKTMKHHRLNMRRFDRIVFNFPHAGIIGDENDDQMIIAHQLLVRGFFLKASHMLRPDGEIHVSHNRGQYYRWKIPKLASECSLVMVEIAAFRHEDYPGYNRKRGYGDRCDEEFPLHNGWTSKFRVGREEAEDYTISTAAQREGEKKMSTPKSSDCEEFEVEEAVAMESQTIRYMIEDDYADKGIPHPNVNSKILYKVIEYYYKHVHATATKPANSGAGAATDTSTAPTALAKDLKNWDDEFIKVVQATFFDLILVQLEEERRLREEAEAAWAAELQQERAARAAQEEEQRIAWEAQEEVNKNLQEQLQAAYYLNIKGFLDFTCQTVADMIKGKTPEEIHKTFDNRNNFTPEEERGDPQGN